MINKLKGEMVSVRFFVGDLWHEMNGPLYHTNRIFFLFPFASRKRHFACA